MLTAERVRKDFLEAIRSRVLYWTDEPSCKYKREALEGLAHRILAMIDGVTTDFAPFDLIYKEYNDDYELVGKFNITDGVYLCTMLFPIEEK